MTTSLEKEIEQHKKKIHSDSYPMSIGEAISMYINGEIDIHPEFQRVYRWTLLQKSKFIESILLGIPIPSFFVSQREDGVWDLVDGLQRFSTILSFMGELKNEDGEKLPPLTLTKGGYLSELDGAIWSDEEKISKPLKLSFRREKIDFKIIKKESTSDTKYDLFRRLNTGGSELSDQEVRNCLLLMANKTFYEWVIQISKNVDFVETTPLSDSKYAEQYNIELLIRFIVFYELKWEDVTAPVIGDIGEFLNDQIIAIAQNPDFDTQNMADIFSKTFHLINSSLGSDAFKRFYPEESKHKGGFSIALFEAISTGIAKNIATVTTQTLREKIENFSLTSDFTAASGAGTRASTRVSKTIPYAITYFSS
ncbi:DUF262 domain-containing protein [Desulfosarcina sp. OttesenSCG-928-A07]|nr:DUF262 domain-containing protein [Desulfosarcina sp. OttesenSCG-928-G17]MDL2328920.1 DUF262 domain-containing protein [Desulfosarcina sp. OttesenSCG-928-A07]